MTTIEQIVKASDGFTKGHRYLSRCEMSPTTDEWIVSAIDFDGGKGTAQRRIPSESLYSMSPDEEKIALASLFEECAAELDKRDAAKGVQR